MYTKKQAKKMAKIETRAEAIFKETLHFAEEAFDSVWLKYKYEKPKLFVNFLESYSARLDVEDKTITKHLTDGISNAVYVSQFLLRNRFKHFFHFTYDPALFKKEVKFMWSHWIEEREDIFIKVIDTIAIIADVFLFCDAYKNFNLELEDASDWFMEWFEEHLASEFFSAGGWKELQKVADEKYTMLYTCIKTRMKEQKKLKYGQFKYDDKFVNLLRHSKVFFPVHESEVKGAFSRSGDENLVRKVVYIRLREEVIIPETTSTSSKPKDVIEEFVDSSSESSSETEILNIADIDAAQSESQVESDKTLQENLSETEDIPEDSNTIKVTTPRDKDSMIKQTSPNQSLAEPSLKDEAVKKSEDEEVLTEPKDSSSRVDDYQIDAKGLKASFDKPVSIVPDSVILSQSVSPLDSISKATDSIDPNRKLKEEIEQPTVYSEDDTTKKQHEGTEKDALPTAYSKETLPEQQEVLPLEGAIAAPVVPDLPKQASNEYGPFGDFVSVLVGFEKLPPTSKFNLISEKYSYSIETMRKQRFKEVRKRKFSITKLKAESRFCKRDFVIGEIGQETIPDSECPLEEMYLSEYICLYLGELNQQQRIISGIAEPPKPENFPDSTPPKSRRKKRSKKSPKQTTP